MSANVSLPTGTKVTITGMPAAHPLNGMTGEVVHQYHDRRGTWFATVKIDRKVREYSKGDELRMKAEWLSV